MSTNPSPIAPILGVTLLPNAGPYVDEHHCGEVLAVCSSIQTDGPPLWKGLLTPTARAAALREGRGHSLNCHEDTHSLKQCRHPFVNASGGLNPDLGELGEACRCWQTCMIRYHREDKPSRSNNQKKQKISRRRRGHSRGQHQSQGQQNNHNDGYSTHETR